MIELDWLCFLAAISMAAWRQGRRSLDRQTAVQSAHIPGIVSSRLYCRGFCGLWTNRHRLLLLVEVDHGGARVYIEFLCPEGGAIPETI